jgi:hypothetical protein
VGSALSGTGVPADATVTLPRNVGCIANRKSP